MSARTQTRPGPAATGVETRLTWWALVPPVLAFAVLLLLMLNPANAQAAQATSSGASSLGHLLARVWEVLS